MTMIYALLLVVTLLVGGAAGWLMITWHYGQVAAEHDEEEQEMAEFQDLYAAWVTSHRTR